MMFGEDVSGALEPRKDRRLPATTRHSKISAEETKSSIIPTSGAETLHLGLLTIQQHDQMVDLLAQLHAHYNPGSRLARETFNAHLQRLCSGDSQLHLVTASQDNRLLGFAAVYLVASLVEPEPDKRLQCALKELFVAPEERSRGVGRALMEWVARFAIDQGCCRIDWTVKSSNARGIDFYERLGAQLVPDRLSYRLERSGVSLVAAP